MMILRSNLFFILDEGQFIKIYKAIFCFRKLIIYFIILQVLTGIINLLYLNNQILGLSEIYFYAVIGIVTINIQVPVCYLMYSVVNVIGCLPYFYDTRFLKAEPLDLTNAINISGIINHLSCSVLSLRIFLTIINTIDWESKFISTGCSLHIAQIRYPRFNNSTSNIVYYTPLDDGTHSHSSNNISLDSENV